MPVKKGARKTFSVGDIRNLYQFGGDLPTLKARKDLTDEFRKQMLCDNPVRFYRLRLRVHSRPSS